MNTYCPTNKEDWRKWLKANHKTSDSIWLIMFKKTSASPNLSWSEAVDQALCFGWIDSTKKSIDDEKYMQYYGKRKPKSSWSKINKQKVQKLIEHGQMQDAGLETIEIAKNNGYWSIMDEVEDLIIPLDLQQEFAKKKGSFEYYQSLSNSKKKGLLYWVVIAKRAETRQKRIIEIVECASKNTRPKQFT